MKEIIINKSTDKVKTIALLKNGKLIEKYDNLNEDRILEGNIYCGKVQNVLPGMQAAFVDIGEDKNAFIHIKDIIPKVSNETGNKEENFGKYDIREHLKSNTPILVQIKKDEADQKGARISTHISLTGRLTVLMANVDFITISKKISDDKERVRLKEIAKKIISEYKGEKYGLILRTGAEGKSQEEIEKDIKELVGILVEVKKQYNKISKAEKVQLIYKNDDVISKFLTSILETEIDQITVNNEKVYNSVSEYLKTIGKKVNIELNKTDDLMQKFDLQSQINKMNERKIWLKCGGFITIDKTEALTAIDVNSGKFTGKKTYGKNDTILKVNKEATVEIAKSLKLRNISGIIVIDYIDMEKQEDREEILKLLETELMKDRSKTQVIGFTKLDLLEMTRKKI